MNYLARAFGPVAVLALLITFAGPLLGNVGPVEIGVIFFFWLLTLATLVALVVTKVQRRVAERRV